MLHVTAQVDGTVIPVRQREKIKVWNTDDEAWQSRDLNFSGKHGEICVKFEVWATMDGIPFWVRGGVPGSWHDARLFDSHRFPFFEHFENELFCADLGYLGLDHCWCPEKAKHGVAMTDDDAKFNQRHSLLRSRIEQLFAWLDVFRVFSFCDHNEEYLHGAVSIATNIFYSIYGCAQAYSDCGTGFDQFANTSRCLCHIGCGVVESALSMEAKYGLKASLLSLPCEPRESRKKAKYFGPHAQPKFWELKTVKNPKRHRE